MNKYIREQIWNECNKANHFIEIPGIYRHFKQIKDNEDMIYAVSNISIPIDMGKYTSLSTESFLDKDNNKQMLFFNHTEKEMLFPSIKDGDKYYHKKDEEPEILVIYTALYGDRKTYVRPLPMFISKTDKVKYPNATQKFRLEQIK